MDKETLYKRVHAMIISSTKEPKYMALSTVKIADLFRVKPEEIEKTLLELVNEGRFKKENLTDRPNYEVYLLPQ
ncbi:hypothetical protein Q8G32_28650 [Priestia megaterium]|uniref:hypothetical protein n=1 Tax=Priestia megaterium TaxID=1404 RepID=UPI00272F8B43|nr:hypothetical protein [Priestia megaterium]MDP1471812.1 hypothetical protein [Priestia megaterium]